MLQETVIPIDFSQGVDKKTDPKLVVAGKMLRLENGIFTSIKSVSKRNGYDGISAVVSDGTPITNPVLTHEYLEELITADSGRLLSYSETQDAWNPKGRYTSVELKRKLVSEDLSASGMCDVAILGNYALYGYSSTTAETFGQVVDLSTGDILLTSLVDSGFFAAVQMVKCVLLGGSTLAIVYQKSTGQYGAKTVIFSGGGVVSFSAETILTTNATGPLDIIPTATGAAIVYPQTTTPGLTVSTVSTTLFVASTAIAAVLGDVRATVVAISRTSNGNLWVYWNETTNDGAGNLTASSIYYAVLSSALAVVLPRTLITALAVPYTFYTSNMMAKANTATEQTLYFGGFISGSNVFSPTPPDCVESCRFVTVTDAGVIGMVTLFAHGVTPLSHSFDVGANQYAAFLYRMSDQLLTLNGVVGPAIQPTFFILELTHFTSPPNVVARFGSGVAASFNGYFQTRISTQNVAILSATKVFMACGIETQELAGSNSYIAGILGVYSYDFDFASINANVAVNSGDVAVLNGANLQMYDGASCVELGFHLFPEIIYQASAAPFGNIADGRYDYLAIFEWIDNQGNLHQSATSEVISITLGSGMPNQVSLTVTAAFLTSKQNGRVAIYRTIGAGGATGSVFYRVGYADSTPVSGSGIPYIVFIDTLSDAALQTKNQAYTYPASSVLENSAPPPSMISVAHNNRYWFVDSENRNTVWYSKSHENGVGLSPSALMLQQFDPKFGFIVAMGEMDEKIAILKEFGIFIQAGDGVNDVGANDTLSFPQIVPSDVGCDQMKSVVLTPNGLMFHSPKGIYLLNRALGVAYIGAEVEAYNNQILTSALLMNGKSQIRFLAASGLTLVFDYIFNQWSTFTNHTGLSATIWKGAYVYAKTSGEIFKESTTRFIDGATPFNLLAQTSWLALGSVQNFERVRRLIMLGDYANGASALHKMQISAAYDFSLTFQPAVAYTFGAAASNGTFQYRERLPIQKCDTLSLLIEEVATGDAAESINFSNMSFEAGVKKGVNKLPATRSVG